jgi:uncharacterized membrane protein
MLGLAGSMRSFTPGAALVLRRRAPAPAKRLAAAAALTEYAYDKTPLAFPRTRAVALYGRAAGGLLNGALVAGPGGALAGAAVAFAGTHATFRLRRRLTAEGGLPDAAVALAEDAAAIALALTGAAPRRPRR